MAAWTYSDWTSQTTARAQLARLKLHITEVSNVLAKVQEGSVNGQVWRRFDLPRYLEGLQKEQSRLEKQVAADAIASGDSRPIRVYGIRMGRPQ